MNEVEDHKMTENSKSISFICHPWDQFSSYLFCVFLDEEVSFIHSVGVVRAEACIIGYASCKLARQTSNHDQEPFVPSKVAWSLKV